MFRYCFVALLVFLSAAAVSSGASAADERFEQLAARYVDEYPALSPVGATRLGDHRFDHLLDEVSESARANEQAFYRRYLKKLEQIDRKKLSRANQVDHALL